MTPPEPRKGRAVGFMIWVFVYGLEVHNHKHTLVTVSRCRGVLPGVCYRGRALRCGRYLFLSYNPMNLGGTSQNVTYYIPGT